jgi:Ca2+-binding RTX toxin-like protein
VLTYHVNNDVWFVAGSGVNTINVDSTSAATIVNAGLSGNDTINVGGPSKTLQGINGGYLDFQISKPGSHLYFNDQGDAYTQPQTYTIGMLQAGVAELLGGNPNAPGGNEFFFTGPLGAVTLNASSGNDRFDVQALWPSPTRLAIQGGTGTNTLVGPNTTNTWVVSGSNSGTLDQTVSFSAVQDLVGGTGVDVFQLAPAGKVASINGGGAPAGLGDWLDYSAFTTPVTVNLAAGAATSVNGGAAGAVRNIQDVHGGNGGNRLTGNAQGNILIGGTGADTIIGGSGRSLLIGGRGADHVTGGSGGSAAGGDILIGGDTTYDAMTAANEAALMAIFAEWQSADSYAARFGKINTGLPGGYKLNYGTTVMDDGQPDTLTGATSGSATPPVDWFFAGPQDRLVNFERGEHRNNR